MEYKACFCTLTCCCCMQSSYLLLLLPFFSFLTFVSPSFCHSLSLPPILSLSRACCYFSISLSFSLSQFLLFLFSFSVSICHCLRGLCMIGGRVQTVADGACWVCVTVPAAELPCQILEVGIRSVPQPSTPQPRAHIHIFQIKL